MHARREEVSGIGRYTVGRQSRPEFLQKMGFKRSRNARGAIPRCKERWHDSLARSLECAVRGNRPVDTGQMVVC